MDYFRDDSLDTWCCHQQDIKRSNQNEFIRISNPFDWVGICLNLITLITLCILITIIKCQWNLNTSIAASISLDCTSEWNQSKLQSTESLGWNWIGVPSGKPPIQIETFFFAHQTVRQNGRIENRKATLIYHFFTLKV